MRTPRSIAFENRALMTQRALLAAQGVLCRLLWNRWISAVVTLARGAIAEDREHVTRERVAMVLRRPWLYAHVDMFLVEAQGELACSTARFVMSFQSRRGSQRGDVVVEVAVDELVVRVDADERGALVDEDIDDERRAEVLAGP